jgi:lipid-A-disaccharide synthase
VVTYLAAKFVVRIKHLGIVNILAGETVVEELVQGQFNPQAVGASVSGLLESPEKREALRAKLAAVVNKLGAGGAYKNAAAAVAEELAVKS